jgi:hypothetical protein
VGGAACWVTAWTTEAGGWDDVLLAGHGGQMPHFDSPSARWMAGGAAILLAAAAFLIWGPLGGGSPPGNGPLFMGSYGLDGGPGDGREQIGIIIPILSSSHSTVVIDGIQLVGGVRYRATYPDAMVTCQGLAHSREWAVMEQAAADRPGS